MDLFVGKLSCTFSYLLFWVLLFALVWVCWVGEENIPQ